MQKTLTVQRRNGNFEEMPEEMALDARLQKKHGWIVVNVPKTVEELKAVVHPFSVSNEHPIEAQIEEVVEDAITVETSTENPILKVDVDGEKIEAEIKKRGRKPRQ